MPGLPGSLHFPSILLCVYPFLSELIFLLRFLNKRRGRLSYLAIFCLESSSPEARVALGVFPVFRVYCKNPSWLRRSRETQSGRFPLPETASSPRTTGQRRVRHASLWQQVGPQGCAAKGPRMPVLREKCLFPLLCLAESASGLRGRTGLSRPQASDLRRGSDLPLASLGPSQRGSSSPWPVFPWSRPGDKRMSRGLCGT